MATVRCPQCGTEFERDALEFCPNPSCGFPLAFLEEPADEEATLPAMERRPGEKVTEEIAPPPPPPEPPPPPAPPPPPPPGRRFPPALLAVGGLVAAVVVVGVVLLTRNGGDPDPDGPTATGETTGPETTPPTVTTTPPESPNGTVSPSPTEPGTVPLVWRAVSLTADGVQAMTALTRYGSGSSPEKPAFVAAGFAVSGPDEDAAVWVASSADGLSWVRADAAPDLGGMGNQRINGLFTNGQRIIAVGTDRADAAVWTSEDGLDWIRRPDPDLTGPGIQVMNRVKGVPGLLIAVGSDTNTPEGGRDGAIWTSRDLGITWQRFADPLRVFGGAGDQVVHRVQEVREGGEITRFVAVGSDGSGGDVDGAVWISDESAETWERVRATDDQGGDVFGGQGVQQILDLASFGTTLVAVGFEDAGPDEDGVVWVSEDGGETWERIPDSDDGPFSGQGDQRMVRVVAPEQPVPGLPRILAAGFDTSGVDDDAVIWFSEDGRAWDRQANGAEALGGSGDQRIATLFARGVPVVAVGTVGSDAAVWTAEPG